MQRLFFFASLFAITTLGGCASDEARYGNSPAAQAALAKCRLQADGLPVTQNEATNPFFVAAMQQQYMNDCMKAAGWSE